ncbi:hypothetical protein GA417_13805, partial [Poseidonibacter ostreae]|uniref:MraY family glycosyltransferase n=1 Tax=Poseidonibacter ostreae TaxID=2654171 RepID=UPI0013BEE694
VLKIKVDITQQIKKTIEQLTNNLNHPSLHNKNIKCKKADNLFSIRVNKQYRILYFVLPFTMFALAGFTNALNLIDGLDGLAGSVSIIILSTFLYIGYINQDQLIIILTSTTITALCAFMLFNWNPASIFMGDSGSLFLGFIISLVAVISIQYIHPITILYLAAIPILDTIVVSIRRIRKGLYPFSPDKTHIHHILLNFFGKTVE